MAESVATSDELKYVRKYPSGPVYAPLTGYYSLVYDKSELEKAEIGEFAQFLTLTPQPVLGLLTYDRRSTNAPHRTPDATEADERRPPGEASQMAKPVAWLVQRVLSWR